MQTRHSTHVILLGVLFLTSEIVSAQNTVTYSPPPRYRWTYYAAVDALASRAFARAEIIRATGEAAVDIAAARNLHADAYRKELQNYVEEVRAVWTRRAIAEAEIQKRKYDHIKATRRRNSQHYEALKEVPGISRKSVVSGEQLNWLMQRLSRNVLAYTYSKNFHSTTHDREALTLAPETLHRLRLRQNRVGTAEMVFRADEGQALKLDWWPWILRAEDFRAYRESLEARRIQLQRESVNGDMTRDSLVEMENAVVALNRRFRLSWPAKQDYPDFARYQKAADFLDSLYGEVRAMQEFGSPLAMNGKLAFDPKTHGDDLVALLRYMWRHGLAFAPAEPADESAYQQVFLMMRDLYDVVAAEDEGIKDDPNYRRPSPPEF